MRRVRCGYLNSMLIAMSLQSIARATPPLFQVTDLGFIGPTNVSVAYAINDYGQVAGKTNGERVAFLWTPTVANGMVGAMIPLPETPSYGTPAQAYDINNYGQVVGITPASSGHSAFLWTPTSPNGTSGTSVGIGEPRAARAHAINSSGQVAVSTPTNPPSNYGQASLWNPTSPNGQAGSIVDLGISPGAVYSGINDRGQVVNDTYVWTPSTDNGSSGSLQGLEPGIFARVYGINAAGDVVGGGIGQTAGDAALWRALDSSGTNYSVVNLGRISVRDSVAFAINDRSEVVGAYSTPSGVIQDSSRAFYWTDELGMMDLNSLLDDSGGNWILHTANDINNAGQIVGFGTYDVDAAGPLPAVTHGYLLTPIPEPDAAAMLIGLLLLRSKSHRNRRPAEASGQAAKIPAFHLTQTLRSC